MSRSSSKLSFWILRASQTKSNFHMQLPLLRKNSLQPQHINFTHQINNASIEYKPKQKQQKINTFLHLYGRFTNRYRIVIHPQSLQLLFWNIFIFIITFANFIEIPILLLIVKDSSYQIYKEMNFQLYYYCVMCIFIFDMLIVRTRISYQQTGKYLTNSEQCLKYYFYKLFIFDLMAILSLILSSLPIEDIDYVKFVFFLKIVQIKEIDRQIKFKLLLWRHSIAIYQFLKLVFFIVLVTNLYTCIYFAIDYYFYTQKGQFYQKGYLWINGSYSLDNIDLLQSFGYVGAYTYALYWSLQTARTCGYGVASPKNYISILYVNFVMLNIIVIFVYFTDGVINIIISHGERRRRKLGVIKKFIDIAQQLQIRRQTKNKLIQEIRFKNSQAEEFQEYLENQLSQTLKKEFKLTFRQHFINFIEMIELISSEDSYSFKINIAQIIKSKHYFKGQVVVRSKSIENAKIFLIERGTCLVQNDQLGYRKKQNEWTVIGKRQFYFQKIPIYNVIAQQPLSGLQMQRNQFIQCLKNYPSVYAKYRQMMDSHLINKHNTYQFEIKCSFCDQFHLHQFCDRLNLWRTHLRIKKNQTQSNDHPRTKLRRKGSKSVKCLKHKCHSYEIDSICHKSEYFKFYNI